MARITVGKVQDFTIHPWGAGSLQVNGVQYGHVYNATTTNTYVTTNAKAFNVIADTYPGGVGAFEELEMGLTAAFQGNATTRCDMKWQGRNLIPLAAAWVDIRPDEEVSLTTAWAEKTVSGYVLPQDNFNSVPFEVRMQYRVNHANIGIAKIKNSSYIRTLYEIA